VIDQSFDVAILGGGPGGYVAALRAAQLGAQVVLVEKERVGGTCLNIGCIPTKALTSSTELLVNARRANEFGISIPSANPHLPSLMMYKQSAVDALVSGVEQLLKERKVTLVRGEGSLLQPDRLRVTDRAGRATEIAAQHLILAPGSITARPSIPGLDLPGVIASTEALNIDSVPERLIVVGGGVIGLEFACIYEALGSRVTVLEMLPTILPGAADEAIAKRLALSLRRRGLTISTGSIVKAIEPSECGLRVTFNDGKGPHTVEGERVLVAVGRWPNTEGIGLREVSVKLNGRAIAVDQHLATNIPNVWAIGDAVGGWMLAHKAMVEGRVVAENVTGGQRTIDYRSVPNVIFTRPEVASVGLTEEQAMAKGSVKVGKFPMMANSRAKANDDTDGFVKIVADAETDRVLGVHIIASVAGTMIAQAAQAMEFGASSEDIAYTCHAHPTHSEAVKEAAMAVQGKPIHM